MATSRSTVGYSAITLAILFNVPYAVLAVTYDYPDVLRRPAAEALAAFAQGGAALVLTWHAFALSALALVPVAILLSMTPARLARNPALAVGAAIAGALAGLAQAMGLWRWVFVVPGLAQAHAAAGADPQAQAAAEQAFWLLNQYGGVAIGEQLGQWLTALFVAMLARLQWTEGLRATALVGAATAAAIVVGTGEGVANALGQGGDAFALTTIAGFLALTVWLLQTGIGLLRTTDTTSSLVPETSG